MMRLMQSMVSTQECPRPTWTTETGRCFAAAGTFDTLARLMVSRWAWRRPIRTEGQRSKHVFQIPVATIEGHVSKFPKNGRRFISKSIGKKQRL